MKWPESDGQCNVAYTKVVDCEGVLNAAGTEQTFYCTFSGKKTGTATPASSNPQQPSTIPSGSSTKPAETGNFNPAKGQGCPEGTQNIGTDSTGGSICAGSGTNPSTPTKVIEKPAPTTTTQPDGTTVKTEVTKVTNSDGSVTTNTKTTYTTPDGATRTHEGSSTGNIPGTSTKGKSDGGGASAGGGGGGGSASESDSFCAKNPNLNVCKNSTVSGECESTSCEGDAIQCAILRQQRKIACEFSKADDMSRLGGNMMSDNDPLKGTFPTKENARKVAMPELNKNAFLGGGSCFADVQFTVQGRQFTIPFAKMCDYLIVLRGVVMLLASLASWKIVSRSILG
ncbi:virulence factor TspB C-terminal domain-related protein [uncultured Oxalicibacterium sp.]|uniref:virulence factor TspB C-terminal domain-related protein n=1 Tax=uncultured Oxalicibacterium sp. TaxID=1168540 RepID=UPI0025FA8ED9|nr:virulence factor TspB C-terminal domain-related protein [uncultured Oxalicibacterium sp.]